MVCKSVSVSIRLTTKQLEENGYRFFDPVMVCKLANLVEKLIQLKVGLLEQKLEGNKTDYRSELLLPEHCIPSPLKVLHSKESNMQLANDGRILLEVNEAIKSCLGTIEFGPAPTLSVGSRHHHSV